MNRATDSFAPQPTNEKRAVLENLLRKKKSEQILVWPLSRGQKALWFLHQAAPDSAAYHVAFSVRIRSAVDISAFARALQSLSDRHCLLRATSKLRDGEPIQEIVGYRPVCFEVCDATGSSEEALREHVDAAYRRPFDLQHGPVFRANLFTLAQDHHVLLFTAHHIVYDGWSLSLNWDELRRLYADEAAGLRSSLALLSNTYCDYIEQQEKILEGPEGDRLWRYWKRKLSGELPTLNLPLDRVRPPVQKYRGASEKFTFGRDLSDRIKTLSKNESVTPFMLLLGAFQVLLHRYSGQDDILVGVPTAGRTNAAFAGIVGYFVNPLVIRADLSGNPTFKSFLQQVRGTLIDAREHQDIPFPLLVERVRPRRDPGYSPVFQTSFVMQKEQHAGGMLDLIAASETTNDKERVVVPKWADLEIEYYDQPQQEGQFDLELEMLDVGNVLFGSFKYHTDLFDVATVQRLAKNFICLMWSIVDTPAERIDRLSLVSASERKQIVQDWNATRVDYRQDAWVHQLFERQAKATPTAPALMHADKCLSYAELNERANCLAHYLLSMGVGVDSVVGVCLERSIEMVVALLAILKAGAAYLPLDPEYPSERLDYMASDAAVSMVLTFTDLANRWRSKGMHTFSLDSEWSRIARYSSSNPGVNLTADDLAYVIYTSGSTGKPKGVAVPHRGLLNRLQWMQAQYGINHSDKVLQKTPFGFDVSVWEFFWPLMTGAVLVMAEPGDHRDSRRLIALIQHFGITTIHFVPSMLRAFLDDIDASSCCSLRRVFCSGEALAYELQQRFFAMLDTDLYNLYGPTEASIDVSHWTCRRDSDDGIVPIGFPIANTSLYILDSDLNPVPIGVLGELHIGGVGLARGYLNKPTLTAEKFIRDPFGPAPGGRLYKTGDLARFRADGAIEYLGRLDHQVKIRGCRIELGEIEAVLMEHSGVKAAVANITEAQGDKRLVAYIVGAPENSPNGTQLRQYLMQRLPDYMVPSYFVSLDALPLNPNGKIDRQALPAPPLVDTRSERSLSSPRDPIEQALVRLWQTVLNVRSIGINDNFFDLGGHSLLAVYLMCEIERDFGKDLPIASLFQNPTIEKLAHVLRTETDAVAWSPLVPIQPHGSQPPLFCVAGGGGNVLYYYALAHHLPDSQPFYGLQAIGLDGTSAPLPRVEDIAAEYIHCIREVQHKGPYFLAGHCFGGLVAFETAQQLQSCGEEIALVVIIDAPAPVARRSAVPLDCGDSDAIWLAKLGAVLSESAGTDLGVAYTALCSLSPEARLAYFQERMQTVGILPPGAGVSQVRGLLNVFVSNSKARYVSNGQYPVPIALFRAGEFHRDYDYSPADDPGQSIAESTLGWRAFSRGPVAVHVVPGNHITMMSEPHVVALAAQLTRRLNRGP